MNVDHRHAHRVRRPTAALHLPDPKRVPSEVGTVTAERLPRTPIPWHALVAPDRPMADGSSHVAVLPTTTIIPSVDISRNEEVPVADVIADLMHANLL